MATFQKCPDDVSAIADGLIEKYHSELHVAGVRINYLFAFAKRDNNGDVTGPALKLHGNPCNGIAKILSGKERALREFDCEISLDGDRWPNLKQEQRAALLDHELNHFKVSRTADGDIKYDEYGRPKLQMRRHDYDFGWFTIIAMRHGEHSFEVQQARLIYTESGQFYLPFIDHETGHVKDQEPIEIEPISLTREDEELVEQCIEIMRAEGKASTSLFQRKLSIGYTRAAKAMEVLEQRGYVSSEEGGGRKLLIPLVPKEDLKSAVKSFHDNMAQLVGPGGAVTITSGDKTVVIKGKRKEGASNA